MPTTISTDRMLTLIQEVAAEVILPRFGGLAEGDVETKEHAEDFVTVADREAEVALTARLREAYPDALVLGEEAAAGDDTLLGAFRRSDHAFTVDPVDGTKNFVRASPDFAVMVAELRGGRPVRSWIWQPIHERAYVAERGAGATRNGAPLPSIPVLGDPGAWVNRAGKRPRLDAALASRVPSGRSSGACSIDYPLIAEGEVASVVYFSASPWDHVPGALLLAELGGVVGDAQGRPYDVTLDHERLIAAGSARVYEAVRQFV